MFLIYDTETTGFPSRYGAPHTDLEAWSTARLVQIAWQLHDIDGSLISAQNILVRPEGFEIPYASEQIHGISTERALAEGVSIQEALGVFEEDLKRTKFLIAHNIEFDLGVVGSEVVRAERSTSLWDIKTIDTKLVSTEYCALPGGRGGKFKWPTLTELHTKLFGEAFQDAHDAAYDVHATTKCFFALITNRVHVPEGADPETITYEAPKLEAANFTKTEEVEEEIVQATVSEVVTDATFVHLHCHSQFSILQSTSTTQHLVDRAVQHKMPAIAMTDHGNMMGAFHFVKSALKAGIKPIVGCEFNLAVDRLDKSHKDDGYQCVVLAKNKNGYHNLCKLSSYAFTEGFYYVPRIDRDLLLKYKEDLIVLSGGLWGEVASKVLNIGEGKAEEAFIWWKENFGDDFYAEINRHGVEEQRVVNKAILRFAKEHQVKIVATNNTYYSDQTESVAHDILLCVKDGEQVQRPKKYIGKRGREFRYGFPNDEFYIKTPQEMKELFADLPEAILNVQEVVDKIEEYVLARDVLLPAFEIPDQFLHEEDKADGGKRGENAYLRHLTLEGAKDRYDEITADIQERLDFELDTIANTGYPGYFLIVQDFCEEARNRGVSVGPGRGSAAGSAVAYCTKITNIDPIKYDLLFERFLNPDRVSLPDIDIDFDDEGRDDVIQYVIDKYGSNQVAQIITYGTMAAKSSIRDTGRVMELPLQDTNRIAKLVPDVKLKKLFKWDEKELKEKFKTNPDGLVMARQLLEMAQGNDLEAETLNLARVIEGSVRNTGIHACGVIITPSDITDFVPVALAKDSEMFCTQFDNSVVEDAGLLKMDFLGLKTLTLIKESVTIIKRKHGITLDPDSFPLDDTLTYELFQRGETVGIFQYESPGMQRYMKELKPTVFDDLIAMNALYRPGPMEYIPSFVKRKHGAEEITYDLPECAEYLEETYGITVYQEQVMLLSQKLAGFTKGEADVLRKAMGKKILELLNDLKPRFIGQAKELGHPEKVLEKIWKDWEAFASYAFNKSHSTCYAWIAYQTAYLKAHYPAEYMAAVLSHNMNDIKQITFFMEECRRMGLDVLGPSVNESQLKFTVNDKGQVRCGLAAIKGVGEGAVQHLIDERENGLYSSVYDFVRRADSKSVNKKVMEGLALAGAFDAFPSLQRAHFFHVDQKGISFIDTLVRYGNAVKEMANSSQASLFGEEDGADIPEPPAPQCEPWTTLDQLNREKEVVGIFISGHPLDEFRLEMRHFTTKGGLALLGQMENIRNKELRFAGMITEAGHKITKTGKPYGVFTFEDYQDSQRIFLFGDDYVKYKDYLVMGWFLHLTGKVQPRRFSKDENEVEFKINRVELLSDVREKIAKNLHITLQLRDLNNGLADKMFETLGAHKGSNNVKVKVRSLDAEIIMPAKNIRVDLSNELVDKLDDFKELEYYVD